MALLVIVIIRDSKEVLFRTLRPYFIGGYIHSYSKSTRVRVSLFAFFLLKLFFIFFSSLLRGFCTTKRVYRFRLLDFWLSFFDLKVPHSSTMSLYLSRGNMSETIVLLDLVVYLLNIKSRLEACFGLSFNSILDHLFEDI